VDRERGRRLPALSERLDVVLANGVTSAARAGGCNCANVGTCIALLEIAKNPAQQLVQSLDLPGIEILVAQATGHPGAYGAARERMPAVTIIAAPTSTAHVSDAMPKAARSRALHNGVA
jgi:hypothetical protein